MLSTVRHCTRTATSPITLSTVNSIIRSPHASQMVFTAAPIILLTSRTFNASFTGRRHISNHPFPGRLRVAAKSPVHYQRVSALTFSECIRITSAGRFITIRAFHASQCNRALPVIGAIFAGLKTSQVLGVLGTLFRVTLTFLPALFIKLRKLMWKLKNQGPTAELLRMLRDLKWSVRVVFLLPLSLLAATIIASLEKTPLTGRWRVILLSPAEEEKIVETLQKTWRSSVNDVLASAVESGTPPAQIPITDWRHRWVEATLRRLENAVSLLQSEPTALLRRPTAKDDYPFPPPSTFPLAARPRPAQSAHEWMNPHHEVSTETNAAGESSKAVEHHNLNLIGPPYSCLVVDDPESQNAFSYGFGPGGAGGVVVFTGFLDEIMQNSSSSSSPHSSSQIVTPPPKSLLSLLFGSLSLTSQRLHEYRPTDKETSELAVLLSHELAHLILAHHLESLSATSILLPSITSILTDVSRAILFPFTWAFGPFINDVLIELGKRRAADARQIGTMKTGRVLEIEADLVSARLLAYAGFDPREAIKFWEARIERSKSNPENPKAVAGCAIQGDTDQVGWTTSTTSWAMGREVHPLNEERIKVLKDELERWEVEWTRLRKRGAVS